DGIRDRNVTGVQTCALPILSGGSATGTRRRGPHGFWDNASHGSLLRGHLPADRPDPARRPLPRTDRTAGRPPLRGGAEPLPPGGGDRMDDPPEIGRAHV